MESQVFKPSYPPIEVLSEALKAMDIAKDELNNREFMRDSGRFPVSVLPKVFRDFIEQASITLATSPDFVALGVLSFVNVGVGNALSKGEIK
ncbi:MAG: hypothetical protein K6T88_21880 [Bacillus sp. (in: Bacteria)]|nr:hypothetical protein [Bacillus sp. (in: firmicutes)]